MVHVYRKSTSVKVCTSCFTTGHDHFLTKHLIGPMVGLLSPCCQTVMASYTTLPCVQAVFIQNEIVKEEVGKPAVIYSDEVIFGKDFELYLYMEYDHRS